MTFANVGTLGTVPGKRDEVVALLTRRSSTLAEIGCLLYEVGVSVDQPNTVFVMELWTSAEAHQASLLRPEASGRSRRHARSCRVRSAALGSM